MTFLANHDDSRALYAIPGKYKHLMMPVNDGSSMSQGEDSDAFLMSFNLLGGIIDAESNGARVIPPCDKVRNCVSSLFLPSLT